MSSIPRAFAAFSANAHTGTASPPWSAVQRVAREGVGRLLLDVVWLRTGLTLKRVASDVLARDRRTVQRWRAGHSPIPCVVQRRLIAFVSGADMPRENR